MAPLCTNFFFDDAELVSAWNWATLLLPLFHLGGWLIGGISKATSVGTKHHQHSQQHAEQNKRPADGRLGHPLLGQEDACLALPFESHPYGEAKRHRGEACDVLGERLLKSEQGITPSPCDCPEIEVRDCVMMLSLS